MTAGVATTGRGPRTNRERLTDDQLLALFRCQLAELDALAERFGSSHWSALRYRNTRANKRVIALREKYGLSARRAPLRPHGTVAPADRAVIRRYMDGDA